MITLLVVLFLPQLRAIVAEKEGEFLSSDLLTTCAQNGYVYTSAELAFQCSKHLSRTHEHVFMMILVG